MSFFEVAFFDTYGIYNGKTVEANKGKGTFYER